MLTKYNYIQVSSIFMSLYLQTLTMSKLLIGYALCLKLVFQPGSNKHRTKTRKQKHTAQRQKTITNKIVQK